MSEGVALVTGGAKRVGRAIVLALAREGFDIAFTYLSSRNEAIELKSQIRGMGRSVLAIDADLTRAEEAASHVFGEFSRQFNRIDLLVNNASLYLGASLNQTDSALMQKLMAIHFESPLLLVQKFEAMLRANRGRVINMADLLAEKPWPQYLAYCASKAALVNLTRGLARELAPDVTVNAIAPGVVEWPASYPQAERDKYLKRVPLARAGTREDVAGLVLFLAGNNSYITGQVINLDGGRSIT